jgi:hypothetical protein
MKDVNEIRSALRRVVANLPLYDISSENTPATLVGSSVNNNYVIGNYDVLRLSSDYPLSYITGFSGGKRGRFLRLFNVGLWEIGISHQSALSLPGNRVRSIDGVGIVLPAGGELTLYYDATEQEWIASYASSADRVSCDLRLTAAQSIPNAAYTAIAWDDVEKDTGGFYSALTPTILRMPATGWYEVSIQIAFNVNAAGLRETIVTSTDNIMFDSRTAVTGSSTNVTCSRQTYLGKGDGVVAFVWQNSGAPLDVNVSGPSGSYSRIVISKM